MPDRSRPLALRLATGLVAIAFVAAACSDGESAIDAGRDDPDDAATATATGGASSTETATDGDAPTSDDGDAPRSDDGTVPDGTAAGGTEPGTSAGPEPSATASASDAPTTTGGTEPPPTDAPLDPLADLPPCPVDALDDAGGPVEITLWYGLTEALGSELQALVDTYNGSQDRVVVTIENQIDYEQTIDNYLQLGVEQRPELVLAPEFVVQSFAESATFVPVGACMRAADVDTSTFLPRALDAYRFGGVQWGLPFNVSSPVLYYVEPVFDAAGLDPADPPLTPDEVRAASEAIVGSGAATYGLVVDVARDSAGGFFEQWFGQAEVPFVDNDNGRSARATEVLFDDETGLAAFEFLSGLRRDDLSVNVGENPGGLDAFLKLVDPSEPGAMTIYTSAALTQLLEALAAGLGDELTVDDLGVGPLPGPTDAPAAQVSGAALWLPAGKGDAAVAAAWDFARFLIEPQSQSTWADATGYVPMRSDAIELDPIATTFADDPRFRVSYDQLAAPVGSPAAARPALGPQREVRQVVVDAIARLYADPAGADPAALLADAADTANRLIANYNDLN